VKEIVFADEIERRVYGETAGDRITPKKAIGLCGVFIREYQERLKHHEKLKKQLFIKYPEEKEDDENSIFINEAKKRIEEYERLQERMRQEAYPKINFRGGLKGLADMLHDLEGAGKIDHVTDKQAAKLFTVQGAPVNPDSLKTVRCRDL